MTSINLGLDTYAIQVAAITEQVERIQENVAGLIVDMHTLIAQRDQARSIAMRLEEENAMLHATLQDRELAK